MKQNLYDKWDAELSVSYDFLEKILTDQGIVEGSLGLAQEVRITKITTDDETRQIFVDCEVGSRNIH